MNNYIKIRQFGRDYTGLIVKIESRLHGIENNDGSCFYEIDGYKVKLLEKDTNLIIDNIFIRDFSEIKFCEGAEES